MTDYQKLQCSIDCIKKLTDFVPKVGIVLGSGLGDFADGINVVAEIPYTDIDGFPVSTVSGHEGKYILGYIGEVPVICMKGRVHFYEGYSMSDVVLPHRLMFLLGAKTIIVTNAAGGINKTFNAGDLMLISDHLSLFVKNPLIGTNIDELGTRFPDMSDIYNKDLRAAVKNIAKENNIPLQEGVYAYMTGPSYESPADIRALGILGADAVGMSTVPEAIALNHCGAQIIGISCISNMAAGISPIPLSHKEVKEACDAASNKFKKLVNAIVLSLK